MNEIASGTPRAGKPDAANVDAAELEKFQAIAANWWDPASEFAPLHRINPLRLAWIDQVAPLAGARVLDVGCGGGILSESMASSGADVTGIDLAEKSLEVAKLHRLESGVQVDYRCIAVEALAAEAPASFDTVTCMEMLEHVPDPASVIAACAALVRPGGHVLFSTINRNPKAFLFAIVGAEYVLDLLPRGTHQFDRFLKPSEIAAVARRHALEPIGTCGLGYNPVTRAYRLLPGDVSVNYMIALRRRTD
jgi:2-polyprenyl-6-hydroxyphenyl methylase/3-demethylubiquinone-9 3-methyltransferase